MEGCNPSALDQEALLTVLQHVRDGVYFVDPERVIQFWSRGAERISGYGASEVVGRPCGEFLMHCDDRGRILCGKHCPLQEAAVRKCAIEGRVWLKHAQGARIPVNVSASPVLDAAGDCVGMVEVFRDVTEELTLLRRAQELESQALIDPLTGAGNRRYAARVLEQSWEAWQRYGDQYGVVLLDIDYFKQVNDRYGHPAGDSVLRSVATTLAGSLRVFDFLGRWGGEEFVALIQNVSAEDAMKVAVRCREVGGSVKVCVGKELVSVTLSAGVALAAECHSAAALMELADARLYQAKQLGRDRIVGPQDARVLTCGDSDEAAA